MDTIKLAQIKIYPQKGKMDLNHNLLLDVLEEISTSHPDVVIFPECFLDGYVVTERKISANNLLDYAIEPQNSPYILPILEYARINRCWVIYTCTRSSPLGAFNSALIINRQGEITGVYDKTHIQTHDMKFLTGQSLPVFQSDFGLFGVLICADRRWPESVRTLALKGARVIFNPTYGMHDTRNKHMMQTRSYESEVFIAFTHPAQSLITNPSGEVICNNRKKSDRFTLTTIDLALVEAVRISPSAHLRDRRSDLYL